MTEIDTAMGGMLEVGNRASGAERPFKSVDDVKEFLSHIPEAERYEVEVDILQRMLQYHNRASDMIEEVFLFVQTGGAFRTHITEDEFIGRWAEVFKIIESNRNRRNKVSEAKKAIYKRWKDDRVLQWLDAGDFSTNYLQSCRRLGGFMGLEQAARLVNAAAVQRLVGGKKWAKDTKGLTSGDFDAACKLRNENVEEVSVQHALELGMTFGVCGFLEEISTDVIAEGAMDLDVDEDVAVAEVAEGGQISPRPAGQNIPELGEGQGGGRVLRPRKQRMPPEEAEEFKIVARDEDSMDEEEMNDAEDQLMEEEEEVAQDGESAGLKKCRCSTDVTLGWKIAVNSRKSYGSVTDMRLLAKMQTFKKVCFPHSRLMAGHIGLCTKRLDFKQLDERLEYVLNHRLEIGNLRTDEETYQWFRIANRPARPSDGLGPYKYSHNQTNPGFSFNQQGILEAWDKSIITRWEDEGSVIVPLFDWWFQVPELKQRLYDEFDAYLWHLREINGRKNIGWLRNMFHSIAQQLMRQDPAYYMLYAALRPDAAWRLVSYPYYAKYGVPGDGTLFCHIDLYIPDLLANRRGASMIQGTVSMDVEDDENCTFFLPGMQHKLGQWWDRVVARGQETSGYVHRINDSIFTKEDSRVLGLEWKCVPCGPGDVRITLPSIPHGATGPATKVRRTMLPWFVAVQDDGETLEVAEGGTWSMLSETHRDQTSPKATPSGLPNRYGATPFRFPAGVELVGLGAISDVLVCRRRWNSPAVLKERNILLGDDREMAHAFIAQWRGKAVPTVLSLYDDMIAEEKRVFGEKSYYYHLERLRVKGIPMPEVEPDVDVLDDDILEEARKEGLLFAEDGAVE
jgi:hypothetical protein